MGAYMKNDDVMIIENRSFSRNHLDILWRVTSLCNYNCDFCIQGNRKEHLRLAAGENEETRWKICGEIRRIIDTASGYSDVKIEMIGGEVTILKDFPKILEYLASSPYNGSIRFNITTNFSAGPDYFYQLSEIIRKYDHGIRRRHLHVGVSFYSAYVSQDEFSAGLRQLIPLLENRKLSLLKRMIGKLGIFSNDRSPMSLNVLYPILTDNDYESFLKMQSHFSGSPVKVMPLVIRNYKTSVTPPVREKMIRRSDQLRVTDRNGDIHSFSNIQALGAEISADGSFCPKGYICDAGIHSFWINALGGVYRCPAIGSDMSLGNILDGSFRLLTEPRIYTSDHCSCNQFGTIRKDPDDAIS